MFSTMRKMAAPGVFRLFLSSIVIIYHLTGVGIGFAAVYVFFIISGFWISTMWKDKYSRTRLPYLTFLISRFWRVLPVFLLGSLMTWSILYFRGVIPNYGDSAFHQIYSNLFVFGYDALVYRANGPAWSLDIEMQFYLIAPLLVAFVTTRVRTLLVCAVVPMIANYLHAEATVAHYIVFFTIGAASAVHGWTPGPKLAFASLFATVCLIAACALSPYGGILMNNHEAESLYKFNDGFCQILAIMMAPFAIYTTSQKGSRRDGMYGDLSYIVFMLHFPWLDALHAYEGTFLQRCATCAELLSIVAVSSLLVWKFFDQPINTLRSKWVVARRRENARDISAVAAVATNINLYSSRRQNIMNT